jgi:uncharacterized glyoxalase superfamily protein PhnB
MRPIGSASKLVPILRYRDIGAAVDWLCGVFGFKKHDVVTAVDGTILEARLICGDDMILLLPTRDPEPWLAKSRKQVITEMQSCYIVVGDVDLHYRHAKAAGVKILDLSEYDYGGRGYSCRDLEGHIWDFGTYDPWQPRHGGAVAASVRQPTSRESQGLRNYINPAIVVAAVMAAAAVGWILLALA